MAGADESKQSTLIDLPCPLLSDTYRTKYSTEGSIKSILSSQGNADSWHIII
jgi:hypothetical protein